MFVWNSEYPGLQRRQVWAIVLLECEQAKNKRKEINNITLNNNTLQERMKG